MSGLPIWASAAMCVLTAVASAREPGFQFMRPVKLPSLEQEELISVPFDSAVYDATQAGLEDLRLRNDAHEAVPFLVRQRKTARTQTVRRKWTAETMTAQPLDEGGLEIHVTLDRDDPAPNGLTLVTPLDNFEKRIRVETSADGQTWQEVAQSTLFDYSRYVDVRKDSVSFPKTDRRHVRIRIDNVTVDQESQLLELTRQLEGAKEINRQERVTIRRQPFRIDKVEFWQDRTKKVAESAVQQTYPARRVRIETLSDRQRTAIRFDMQEEPLTTLTMETSERNFSRRAIVEVEEVDGVQRKWRTLAEATLTRIDFKDLQREQLSISFPEIRKRTYRILIENRDSPPLNITGIRAQGNVYEAIFLARPERSYHLVYGDSDRKPARHNTQVLEELLEKNYTPRSAELGEQQPHATSEETDDFEWLAILNNRMLLLALIGVLVLVLGASLYRASRRLDDTPPTPPPDT